MEVDPTPLWQQPAFWAAVAAFFSAIGICVNAWETRRNNRLAVLPMLSVGAAGSDDRKSWTLRLSNDGLGPAVITRLFIEHDDKRFEWASRDAVDQLQDESVPIGFEIGGPTIISVSKTLLPRESVQILIVSRQDKGMIDSDEAEPLAWLCALQVGYEYRTMHGDVHSPAPDRLPSSARHNQDAGPESDQAGPTG